ncbi:O-antigen ligase family protein [Paenibacillus mendelii]|uniref:O-antigen ligase family protein n=1 Tax=Paenibacillus mendelii TaxID=206163 RepID=A0ABV6JIZ6_9BACL|nr:O-antigen ligase family protein [Paenibacillus mendelii]MCQ6558819.1 O-antigen ligase family protein [Paenibacillus mendelii]
MPGAIAVTAACCCAIVLIVSSYRNGMFFDVSFYRWEWLLAIAALVSMLLAPILRLRQKGPGADAARSELLAGDRGAGLGSKLQPSANRGGSPRTQSNAAPWRVVPAAAYGPLAIALMYASQLAFEPVSVNGTIEQALRWSAYGAFLWSLFFWLRPPAGRIWLAAALQAAGAFVLWGALAGWMGWSSFPDIIMVTGDEQLSGTGARLAGFFQYPNMLAAVAGAYLVWQWQLLVRSSSWLALGAAAVQAVPAALVLLLTESRGAWLAAAIGWMAGLLLLGRQARTGWLLYSGWTLLAAGAAYRLLLPAGFHQGAGSPLGSELIEGAVLAAAVLASFFVMTCIRLWLNRGLGRREHLISWGGWAVSVMITLLLLAEAVQGRVSGNFQTAGSRMLFYKDALKLFMDKPLFGRGGDTWQMMFTQVQSQPYVGSEVHSGYLELLLDLGLAGTAIFAVMLGVLLLRVFRHNRAGLIPLSVLLLHAAVDFDMSYGFYWLLVFGWIALYSIEGARPAEAAADEGTVPPAKRLRTAVRAAGAVTAAMIFAAAAATGWQLDRAAQHRASAIAAGGDARAAALRAALEANPHWTRIRIELAPLAPPQERAGLLAAGLRDEPQSVPLLWALGTEAAERGDVPQAAAHMRLALRYDRFARVKQTDAVIAMTRLAQSKRAGHDYADARLAAQTALGFFDAYEALGRESYQANGRRFTVTEEAAAAAKESRRLLASLPEQ